ncbi:hypothetical protein HHK36_032157 [Tetracentron sinense]|uniref:Uncharacterized protein n=1 Tax=Tetracentron sinense TaxID=13715 RepID=A0A834Y5P0_TETSI|nr:hypothetical protein HHK36_032157 [Tetracentron sinense]
MVKVIESCMVVPNAETPKHGIWVSNLDILAPRKHTPTVYFYRPNGGLSFFSPETLKSALAKILVLFYPFAGRLGVDQNGRIEINCNGDGALFAKAEAESTIDEFGDFTPSMKTRELLIPQVDPSEGDSPCPLLLLQVTFFKCGGVCLGIGVHHTLSDGAASLQFINSWSDTARGLNVTLPPFLDRTLLRARSSPNILFDHTEYKPNPNPLAQQRQPFTSILLTLSSHQLQLLKTISNNSNISHTYTTYEIVAAHVWRCACKARELGDVQETRVYITADGRNRLQPPLPAGYIGNAIFTSSAVSMAGDVMAKPITYAANKIRKSITRLNDEYLRSSLDFLEIEKEKLGRLGRGSGTFPCTDLSIVSWTRLPIYEADFGWGRPVFMGPASFFYGGLAYIMPSPGNDGGLSLAISLEMEHISHFRKLFYHLEMDENFSNEGMGPIPSRWIGFWQNNTRVGVRCNKRLIGARYFNKGYEVKSLAVLGEFFSIARDLNAHGSMAPSLCKPSASVLAQGRV